MYTVWENVPESDWERFFAVVIIVICGIGLYPIPKGISRFVYWIKDGFDLDKNQ